MSSRYVYTCVRVPIEITSDGKKITHNDRMQVSFEECAELPALGVVDANQAFQEYLTHPLPEPESDSESEPDSEPIQIPMVLKSEIKHSPKPQLQNSTFKNRTSSHLRHSRKVR